VIVLLQQTNAFDSNLLILRERENVGQGGMGG
jgi:hypothetical protein